MVPKTEFVRDQPEDSTSTPENGPDCSGDESYEVTAPLPKKSRKGSQKKVITVPIGDGDGTRSRGEVYPPPDSWSWRKYGQKPIKGSPYPRGYYRCSSSKGCPSRKQVERSCLDPTMLLITYTCEHNHPIPTSNKHHHSPSAAAATTRSATAVVKTEVPSTSTASTSSTSSDIVTVKEEVKEEVQEEEVMVFTHQPDFDSDQSSGFRELASDMGWFSDVGSTMLDSQALVGPSWMDAYASVMQPIGEEDQSLFGDLGELPEYSMVFPRREVEGTTC